MYLKILMDNHSAGCDLKTEHGFSALVENGSGRLLFDTGAGGAFLENAEKTGSAVPRDIPLVLSHAHYDHAGGVASLLEYGWRGQLFTGAGFFTEKGKLMDGEYYDLGPGFRREDLERCGVRNTVVERSCLIFPGMSLFSGLRSPGNGYFYLKDGGDFCEDPFQEELHLLVSGKDASALITGCAHCGIARIVEKANSLFPEFPVREVYGGLHLSRLPDEQIRETGKRLMELGIKKAGLCHCSGGRLPDFFPGGPFFPVSAGERVELLS